jgi:hypothetical protein
MMSISPDGKWITAAVGVPGGHGDSNTIIKAFPVAGGEPILLCDSCLVSFGPSARQYAPPVSWSPDGKWLYFSLRHFFQESRKTLEFPMTPGSPPVALLKNIHSEADAVKMRGVRVINEETIVPGDSPNRYVFTRKAVTANLFRLYFEP